MKEAYERKVNVTGGLWDAYKFYKNKYKKSVVDRKLYVTVCQEFNKRISDKIIRESTEFRLFNRLGFIRIKTFKLAIRIKNGKIDTQRNSVNWSKTLDLWEQLYGTRDRRALKDIPNKKLVIHTNEHSNGYSMKWYWDKRGCNIKNKTLYKFNPVKGGVSDGCYYGRRGLSSWIQSDERTNEYYL